MGTQSLLGEIKRYDQGLDVDQSFQRARELYELVAGHGNASAQYNLGIMYLLGTHTESRCTVDQSYEQKNTSRQQQDSREKGQGAVQSGHLYAGRRGAKQHETAHDYKINIQYTTYTNTFYCGEVKNNI